MKMDDLSIDHAIEDLRHAIEKKKIELKEKIRPPESSSLFSVDELPHVLQKARELTESQLGKFQNEIKESPWEFLTKVGLMSLGVGLMIGSKIQSRRKTT
jgi:hypothetical protein